MKIVVYKKTVFYKGILNWNKDDRNIIISYTGIRFYHTGIQPWYTYIEIRGYSVVSMNRNTDVITIGRNTEILIIHEVTVIPILEIE